MERGAGDALLEAVLNPALLEGEGGGVIVRAQHTTP